MNYFRITIIFAVILVVSTAWWLHGHAAVHAQAAPPQPAVPVSAVPAKVADVPIDLRGLGTVQAFNTVEIKAQVNGTLIAIPVQEGQEVHQGDIVAVIDPRPFRAALDQATAQRAEDQAQLQSAQLDLARFQHLAKSQFAPVQQVDDQQATVNKLQAAIQADTRAKRFSLFNDIQPCNLRSPGIGTQ